jgi:iron complex outermembrane receptor protein
MEHLDYYSNHADAAGTVVEPLDGNYLGFISHFHELEAHSLEKNRQTATGLYAQYRFMANERFSLLAGVRYDGYDDIGNAVNPRIALVYHAPFKGTFKLLGGSAFRAPSIAELYVKDFQLEGNKDLTPETVQTLELVYLQPIKKWNVGTTLFYNQVHRQIEHSEEATGVESWVNLPNITGIYGVELEASGAITAALHTRFAYTVMGGGISDRAATHFGNISLFYSGKKFKYSLSGVFRGNIHDSDGDDDEEANEASSNFMIFNARGQYQLSRSINLFCFIKNIGDFRYKIEADEFSEKTGLPILGEGREIRIGLEMKLGVK